MGKNGPSIKTRSSTDAPEVVSPCKKPKARLGHDCGSSGDSDAPVRGIPLSAGQEKTIGQHLLGADVNTEHYAPCVGLTEFHTSGHCNGPEMQIPRSCHFVVSLYTLHMNPLTKAAHSPKACYFASYPVALVLTVILYKTALCQLSYLLYQLFYDAFSS
jgi:hypothetical protein